jgi:GAF domain-containing protein
VGRLRRGRRAQDRPARACRHELHSGSASPGRTTTADEVGRRRDRTGRACPVQNILDDPRFEPWREEAAARGYAAVCGLPLVSGERTFGALGIYSSAPDAFDSEEVALLSELASDLAFGIAGLRTQAERTGL